MTAKYVFYTVQMYPEYYLTGKEPYRNHMLMYPTYYAVGHVKSHNVQGTQMYQSAAFVSREKLHTYDVPVRIRLDALALASVNDWSFRPGSSDFTKYFLAYIQLRTTSVFLSLNPHRS